MKKIFLLLLIPCALVSCGRKTPSTDDQSKQSRHFPAPVMEQHKMGAMERHVYATLPLCQAEVARGRAGLSDILFAHNFALDQGAMGVNVYMKNGDVYRYACLPTVKSPGVIYIMMHEVKRTGSDLLFQSGQHFYPIATPAKKP